MVQNRVIETNEGIQSEVSVVMYDKMNRNLRDRGWMETEDIIKSGMDTGHALEIGPGPGYLGLEWLSKTSGTCLTGMEISQAMINQASKNAEEYGFADRVMYQRGNAMSLPFPDGSFDAVFSNGSLHEWEQPEAVFSELLRVLKPGCRFFVSDLKRDMVWPIKLFIKMNTKPKSIRSGLISSINAAYTKSEISSILRGAGLDDFEVSAGFIGLTIKGKKK